MVNSMPTSRRKLFGLAVVGTFFSGMGRALAVMHAGPVIEQRPFPSDPATQPSATFKFIVKMPLVYFAGEDNFAVAEVTGCPPGMVAPYVGDTAPNGWKLFDNVADAFAYSYEIAARPPA